MPGVWSGEMALHCATGVVRLLICGAMLVWRLLKVVRLQETDYKQENDEDIEEELFNSYPLQDQADDLYSEFFQHKLTSVRGQLQEIDTELEARELLHGKLIQEIDQQILSASLFLDRLKHWQIGYRVGVDMERNLWERKMADLLKEKRMEKLRLWRESVSLKEDRRELFKEYEDLLKRRHLLR
jgi:hypothetical protein